MPDPHHPTGPELPPPAPPHSEPPPGAWPGPWPQSPPVSSAPHGWPATPPPGWSPPGPPPPPEPSGPEHGSSGRRRAVYAGAVLATVLVVIALAVLGQDEDERTPVMPSPPPAAVPDVGGDPVACRDERRHPDLGGGHLEMTPDALAPNPPSVLYAHEPPTSGPHIGQVLASGPYEGRIDPRLTTHNLEHGYVVAWYDSDAPADTVGELLLWTWRQVEQEGRKVIAAGYPGTFEGDADVAFTAWRFSQLCEAFVEEAAMAFIWAHHDVLGEAPERGLPAHEPDDPGVLAPLSGDLLLPPLDE